jgi:hypothetical protein
MTSLSPFAARTPTTTQSGSSSITLLIISTNSNLSYFTLNTELGGDQPPSGYQPQENKMRDIRKWKLISDYFGNDPGPYTTKQVFDYAADCNREHSGELDWQPFELVDAGNEIHDLSHQHGTEGFIVAVLLQEGA